MHFWARSSILARLCDKSTPPETPPEGRKGRTGEIELGQRPIDLQSFSHGLGPIVADAIPCNPATSVSAHYLYLPLGAVLTRPETCLTHNLRSPKTLKVSDPLTFRVFALLSFLPILGRVSPRAFLGTL